MEKISEAKTDDEIWALIQDEKDVDVLKFAKERIEQLTQVNAETAATEATPAETPADTTGAGDAAAPTI